MPSKRKSVNGPRKRGRASTRAGSNRGGNRGVRDERLARDGQTFSALTALPRTLTPAPLIYTIHQEYTLLNWFTTSTTLAVHQAHYINIASVNQVSSLGAIFDQYMIDDVEIWVVPEVSAASSLTATGLLSTVVDLDDANALSTFAEYGDYANCVTTQSTQGHYRHFVPHVAIAAYNSTFSGFSNQPRTWIDMASTTVQHYGLKMGTTASGLVFQYSLVVRLRIHFKSAR